MPGFRAQNTFRHRSLQSQWTPDRKQPLTDRCPLGVTEKNSGEFGRVRRFKKVGTILSKLQSPNLEKALTFLDDTLLPSTSNAVERGNRRYRKMQKTVYRVRTQDHINDRLALDMVRDSQKPGRSGTIGTLHQERAA